MSDIRDEMLRTLDRLVEANLTIAERELADGKGPSAKLWAALTEQGMTALGEQASEIPFADAMALVARSGYHALPVPLAETIMARRLLSRAGIALPEGSITFAARIPGQAGLAGVAYGGSARHLVVADGDTLHSCSIRCGWRVLRHGKQPLHFTTDDEFHRYLSFRRCKLHTSFVGKHELSTPTCAYI